MGSEVMEKNNPHRALLNRFFGEKKIVDILTDVV